MIEYSDLIVQFAFSSIVIVLILLINKSDLNFTYKLFFSTVVLLESTTSFLFFSNKFSKLLSLLLFFASIYSIKSINSMKNISADSNREFNVSNRFTKTSKYLGTSIVFITVISEFTIFDGNFSPFTFFTIGLGIFIGFYDFIPKVYLNEKRFC